MTAVTSLVVAACLIGRTTLSMGFAGWVPWSYKVQSGVAVIAGVGDFRTVRGLLNFNQPSLDGPVIIRGSIQGLSPGLHGMHIHMDGNLTDDCQAAGAHFNPFKKTHGSLVDKERHVGDLGNIESYPGSPPKSNILIIDSAISLDGDRGVLHRSVVIHSQADDLGRGNNAESKKTGNSGRRVACGLILPAH